MSFKEVCYLPKSGGRLVRDISLRPSTVRLRSCTKPGGNLQKKNIIYMNISLGILCPCSQWLLILTHNVQDRLVTDILLRSSTVRLQKCTKPGSNQPKKKYLYNILVYSPWYKACNQTSQLSTDIIFVAFLLHTCKPGQQPYIRPLLLPAIFLQSHYSLTILSLNSSLT